MADGQWQHKNRARQLIVFSGMQWGKISPTDIDCAIEFRDKLFIFVEIKFSGTPVQIGQRLCLERMASAISSSDGKLAVSIVADHWTPSSEDVDCAGCIVREVFVDGRWRQTKERITVKQAIDYFYRLTFPE